MSQPQDPSQPPPGWYPDPGGQQLMRWWDGSSWGQHTQPMTGQQAPGRTPVNAPPEAQRRGRGARRALSTVLAIAGTFVLLLVIGAVVAAVNGGKGAPVGSGSAQAASASGTDGVGSAFSVSDESGDTYQVTLVKILDPAHSTDSFNAPDSGTRFTAAVFTVKAVSGNPQNEDANNSASVIGTDGQSYSPQFADIAGYTNFDDGSIHVTQGQSVTGAVVFQIPDNVKIAKVQWTPQDGFGNPVQWSAGTQAAAKSSGGSCHDQVAAWKAVKGDKKTEAAMNDVAVVSTDTSKLVADSQASASGAGDAEALAGAAGKLQSDIRAARADPAPLCIANLRADDGGFFANASQMATALSQAAGAYENADTATENQDIDTANSWAGKMDSDLDAIGRDMKAYNPS